MPLKRMACLLHRRPMAIVLHTAGLPSQPHQGVGARLIRRLGGAVRSAIVSGITFAGTLRRPPVSQASRDHAAARDPQAPAPGRVRVPSRPQTAFRASSLLRLLARPHRRPARLNQGDTPFTPEAYPQLSPKACAVLNTPLEECDPKTLELLVSTFTQYINQVMSPEAGITDPQAVLSNLWHRISTALDDARADTSLPATPQPVPAAPADEAPDAPVLSPHPPMQAPPTRPRPSSAKDAPRLSPVLLSYPPADDVITAVAPRTTPDLAAPSAPAGHASWPLSNPGRSFRNPTQSVARSRAFHCFRVLFPSKGVRDTPPCLPPPWRLYYAACTGPPRRVA